MRLQRDAIRLARDLEMISTDALKSINAQQFMHLRVWHDDISDAW